MPKWRTLSRYIMNNINAQSRIKAVSSLSTTKNLAATGERLGAVALTPQASDFAKYARSCNSAAHGNNNSLLMLNCSCCPTIISFCSSIVSCISSTIYLTVLRFMILSSSENIPITSPTFRHM